MHDKKLTVRQRYWLNTLTTARTTLEIRPPLFLNSYLMALNGLKLEYPLGSV